MRDQATNRNINRNDSKLKTSLEEQRIATHNKSTPVKLQFDTGDAVLIKDQLTKLKPREKFVVVDPHRSDSHVTIQKQDKNNVLKSYFKTRVGKSDF